MKYLQIDVYQYPNSLCLGSRTIPYREFKNGEKIISNHLEINSQVEEVRILHSKNKNEIYFKTNIINN